MARPRSEKARQKAMTAAVDLISESGFDSFTVDEVARRSGVAKTTIYRNWDSSQDLLFDALNAIVEPEPTPDTGSLVTDMAAFVDFLLHRQNDSTTRHRQIFAGLCVASASDPRSERLLRRIVDYRGDPIRQSLARAQDRGELPDDTDLDLAADFIMGSIMFRIMVRGVTFSPEELAGVVNWALRGIGVESVAPAEPTDRRHRSGS